jgi:hypothetical protein
MIICFLRAGGRFAAMAVCAGGFIGYDIATTIHRQPWANGTMTKE